MVSMPNPLHLPQPHSSINKAAAKLVSSIFKCSVCLNIATLPAAACSSCYSVIGCIPCIEQWYESSVSNRNKCPLCRTTNKEYHIIPLLRDVALLLQQPIYQIRKKVMQVKAEVKPVFIAIRSPWMPFHTAKTML